MVEWCLRTLAGCLCSQRQIRTTDTGTSTTKNRKKKKKKKKEEAAAT